MDAVPPPLPPPPKESFKLPWYAWLACAVVIAVPVVRALARSEPLSAYQVGYLIGTVTCFWLLPTVLAWLVWRVAGRSRIARDVTFFCVLAVIVLSSLTQWLNAGRRQRALQEAKAAEQDVERLQRAAVAQGQDANSEEIRAALRKAASARTAAGRSMSRRTQVVFEADEAVNAAFRAAQIKFEAAVRELQPATFFNIGRFTDRDVIATDREHVKAFAAANEALAERVRLAAFDFSRELRDRQLDETAVRDAVAQYRVNTTTRFTPIGKIREAESELANVMLDFLDFVETNFGAWDYESESKRVLFPDAATLSRYNALMLRLKNAQLRETTARKDLDAANAARPGKPGN